MWIQASDIIKSIITAFIIGLFFLPFLLKAQIPDDRHKQIRAALDRGDTNAAILGLEAMRDAAADAFALNNYDYLYARLLQGRGDIANAELYFQSVVERRSVLEYYALWHQAEISRSIGNLVVERQLLQRIANGSGNVNPRLRVTAALRLAESFHASGDAAGAIGAVKFLTSDAKSADGRRAILLTAGAQERLGERAAARTTYLRLLNEMSNFAAPDDYALEAARHLDALDGFTDSAANSTANNLTDGEHQQRARVYQFNRDFAGGRRHWQIIRERFPQSVWRADALFQTGHGYGQSGDFASALPFYEQTVREYADTDLARDALLQQAATLARLQRTDDALAVYRQYIARYPNSSSPERAYLNIIDLLRDAGRDSEALAQVNAARVALRGQIGDTLALFSQAKIHLAQRAWQAALKDCAELLATPNLAQTTSAAGGTSRSEILFLKAYALEMAGDMEAAIAAYLDVPEGRNEYYGWRAEERIAALAAGEKQRNSISNRAAQLKSSAEQNLAARRFEDARQSLQRYLRLTPNGATRATALAMLRRVYTNLPAYNQLNEPRVLSLGRQTISAPQDAVSTPTAQLAGDEFLFLGLSDEAALESLSAPVNSSATTSDGANSNFNQDAAYTLANVYLRGERPQTALRYAEPLWRKLPADYVWEAAPRTWLEILFPVPQRRALLEYAPPRGIDPRFILSLARQESRFLAEAKSNAAARGMLQFIPSTADRIANELQLQNFRQDDLYQPPTAILFGAQYLSNLFKEFPNLPHAVAASYNGGEDNVARWVARARTKEPDGYVPELNFAQTKDYVWRVMTNYRIYQMLYDENLERRSS